MIYGGKSTGVRMGDAEKLRTGALFFKRNERTIF